MRARMLLASLTVVLAGSLCASASAADLVDVRRYANSIQVDVRYATANNFTGAPLAGYCQAQALMLRPRARALARVQRALGRRGLGLKVFDAYRPARASRAMVRWARRTGNRDLLEDGYIAPKSNHNLGSTVDLTLVRLANGRELEMGTAYDAFTRGANTTRARDRALRNRLILKNAMENQAFVNYFREWWHFDSEEPGARRLDAPIGC
ncbi:MAG: peptidase M15 [Actinomycetota bacterium]|nr:peptidase M15 [Actinomycetota bacterium]